MLHGIDGQKPQSHGDGSCEPKAILEMRAFGSKTMADLKLFGWTEKERPSPGLAEERREVRNPNLTERKGSDHSRCWAVHRMSQLCCDG